MNPDQAKLRIGEAMSILRQLGLPRAQQNDRSALTLLALVDVIPRTRWAQASAPLCGITRMMEWFSSNYGKRYAPNTRETVRRFTIHQFVQAGLVVRNPDNPDRSVNSPKAVYQIEGSALELLRSYGTAEWERSLGAYQASRETLAHRYAQEREISRSPVQIAPDKTINLSPGGHNILVRQVLVEFAPRFTAGGKVLYVGDTGEKRAYFDETGFNEMGLHFDSHGKMPDVVIYHTRKGWLVLIEAVTSHGPVNPKRRLELQELLEGAKAGLVFVTAFLTRKAMLQYLTEISWETEVWVAEAPSHMIHFNGERFLGPH